MYLFNLSFHSRRADRKRAAPLRDLAKRQAEGAANQRESRVISMQSCAEQGEIGPDLLRAACRMELEDLVSKHRDRAYRSGPCGELGSVCRFYHRPAIGSHR
jgi:ATP-dependent DNA ligase